MESYNALRFLRVAVSNDLRTIPQHLLDYIANLKVKNFVHEIHYKTDKPKIIELGDAMDTNPYHFFFYMIARFYYFDHGDKTLDALYPPLQKMIDEVMNNYPNELWKSLYFKDKDHSENSWKERVNLPLQFLLSNIKNN